MKVFTWLGLTVGLGLTAAWVAGGLAGDEVFAWLNGWLVGPLVLLFVVPTLFSPAGPLPARRARGGGHRRAAARAAGRPRPRARGEGPRDAAPVAHHLPDGESDVAVLTTLM